MNHVPIAIVRPREVEHTAIAIQYETGASARFVQMCALIEQVTGNECYGVESSE